MIERDRERKSLDTEFALSTPTVDNCHSFIWGSLKPNLLFMFSCYVVIHLEFLILKNMLAENVPSAAFTWMPVIIQSVIFMEEINKYDKFLNSPFFSPPIKQLEYFTDDSLFLILSLFF